MHRIKINNKYDYSVDIISEATLINNEEVNADIKQLNATNWHVLKNLKSYNIEVVNFSKVSKTAELKVNNNTYHITAKDQFDILLEQMGLSNLTTTRIIELKAPMPGMVLKVFAVEGAEVKKGENLFILEAMKMENIIKAPDDVKVKTVKIKPGDKVEKGQIVLLFN